MIAEFNLYDSYETYKLQSSNKQYILPVTLVTGYLGSGKTTLVKHALKNKLNLRIASVVNDFGEVDHDGAILDKVGLEKQATKLTGDCMCCSSQLKSGMKDSIWELLQAPNTPGSTQDQLDYLIIETSGVTDPTSIIELLEMRYGKLTRARLDCVVTVVDMDLLSSDLAEHGKTNSAAAEVQLRSADVVVLNKEDLVSDEGKEACLQYVSSVNPTAIIHTCSYGHLPLHHFLDLMMTVSQAAEAVSHEKGDMPTLHVSPQGGKFRKRLGERNPTSPSSCNHHHHPPKPPDHHMHELGGALRHLEIDGLNSVTFQSKRSLSLQRFQDFVSAYLPAGVVRMKGVLTFQEEPTKRAIFNLSGKKRLGFELDGNWAGPASSYLVVIGNGLDKTATLEQLETLVAGVNTQGQQEGSGNSDEYENAMELLENDLRFDTLEKDSIMDKVADNVIYFRLTGSRALNLTLDQLHLRYGLNFNAMNHLCMNLMNAEGILVTCSRLVCEEDNNPQLWLRYAVGGEQPFERIWDTLCMCATETMRQHTSHINMCSCGC
mmetsp:Transcript_7559/g.10069  ORF Transcript_7559/g.10069 Transcript_7559/m.10069 type:complete len:546 (-) Transcript_7559:230-1867(-)